MISTLEELNKMILLTIQKATPAEKRQLKRAVLKVLRSDAGISLIEVLIVLGVVMTIFFIGTPILLAALNSVKSLMALVQQVQVR